jgi:hypothetical protein
MIIVRADVDLNREKRSDGATGPDVGGRSRRQASSRTCVRLARETAALPHLPLRLVREVLIGEGQFVKIRSLDTVSNYRISRESKNIVEGIQKLKDGESPWPSSSLWLLSCCHKIKTKS